jgi:hypothetical protein
MCNGFLIHYVFHPNNDTGPFYTKPRSNETLQAIALKRDELDIRLKSDFSIETVAGNWSKKVILQHHEMVIVERCFTDTLLL